MSNSLLEMKAFEFAKSIKSWISVNALLICLLRPFYSLSVTSDRLEGNNDRLSVLEPWVAKDFRFKRLSSPGPLD